VSSPGSARRQRRSERRRRLIWIAVGVAVLAAIAVVAVVVLSGGSDSNDSASTATTGSGSTVTTPSGATTPNPTGKDKDTTTTTAGRPGGPCKAADVDVAPAGSNVKGANLVSVVSVTNTGGRSCTLEGYPGLAFLGPDDAKLTTNVVQGGGGVPADLGVSTITLENGAKASFVMSWDAVSGSCLDVRSYDVTLPGDSKATNVKSSVTICGNGAVNISPFQNGTVSA
jgi:hypothetical protein